MAYSEKSDFDLIDLILSGHNSAFNQLVTRYSRRLISVIYSIVKDTDTAEDLLQDVFIKVFQNLKGFRGQSSLITWMTRIAVNLSLNFAKKNNKKRKRELHLSQTSTDIENERQYYEDKYMKDDKNPEDDFIYEEQREKIAELVNQLDDTHQLVLRLKYFEDFSTREISEILEKPEGTIRSRLFYARAELKKKLEKYL